MPSCILKIDHPLRTQLIKPKGVIHAVRKTKRGWYYTACGQPAEPFDRDGQSKRVKRNLVSRKESITCKRCCTVLGFNIKETRPERFIIVRKGSGEYYDRNSCERWSKNILDATLYKSEKAALETTSDRFYFNAQHELINADEYYPQPKKGFYTKRIPDPKLKVIPVKISVIPIAKGKPMDDCRHFDVDDASCEIGINGGYCIVCWQDEPCDKMEAR